jgi:predicted transcriptional regulator
MQKFIGVTAQGRRVGQYHQNAVLTDREVEQMREMHEREGWTAKALAEKFDVSRSSAEKILRYERRAAVIERWRT